jgi:antitoxin PrlF
VKEISPDVDRVNMKDYGIIDSEGQVALPQSVRDHLGLKAGDRVEFVVEGEGIVIRPTGRRKIPLRNIVGF